MRQRLQRWVAGVILVAMAVGCAGPAGPVVPGAGQWDAALWDTAIWGP